MKLSEDIPGIIHVEMPSQLELAQLFVRFQEHYESPEFRGEVFTLGQFRTWYAKQFNGFTYYEDWTGFNVPSEALCPFRTGIFDPLTAEEQKLLTMIPDRLEPYYVIGTFGSNSALDHEICHGLYFIDDKYRNDVNKVILRNMSKLKDLEKHLLKLGYCEEVIVDECHAYICEDTDYLDRQGVKYPPIKKELKAIKKDALRRRKK